MKQEYSQSLTHIHSLRVFGRERNGASIVVQIAGWLAGGSLLSSEQTLPTFRNMFESQSQQSKVRIKCVYSERHTCCKMEGDKGTPKNKGISAIIVTNIVLV